MDGSVLQIFIGPKAQEPMQRVAEVRAIAGAGLEGDRYCTGEGSYNKRTGVGNRQVTLINALFFGNTFEYAESRRNIITHRVELMWLIGREFQIGEARFRGVKYCDPCDVPTELSDKTESFRDLFSDRGGLIAEVLQSGLIREGDKITPPPKPY